MKRIGWMFFAIGVIALAPSAGVTQTTLAKCQTTVAKESGKYIRTVADNIGKCLRKMSTETIENGASSATAASTAAGDCVKRLRKIVNSSDSSKQLGDKLNAKVGKACDPAINPGLTHSAADTYTVGATTLSAANLGTYCQDFGGSGTIASFNAWRDCVRTAADCQARQAVALQWPRALEYFSALQTAITALPASPATTDALVALNAIDSAIEGIPNNDLPDLTCGSSVIEPGGLLTTGQTLCDQGNNTLGPCPGSPAGQDAAIGNGAAFSYTDNLDGTITDNVTGLMWEKMGFADPLNSLGTSYTWYDAFSVKIAGLNAGAGYAGYTDWRLPNIRELESLVDDGSTGLAIAPIFDSNCVPGCSPLSCSCTRNGPYHSSTSFPNGFGDAWGINFWTGESFLSPKGLGRTVRAVRGGL